MTFPDEATAERIGSALLDEGLVACVNIVPGARSLYRWEGTVQREREALAFAKTRAERVAAVVARVRQLHPYDTPCVVALTVAGGDPAYLRWVDAETRGASAGGPREDGLGEG
jgi:periplasmic divalent cation tolerance protein